MEKDEKLMEFCIEMARQGIDIEKLFKDLEPVFEVAKQIADLGIKNYKFMKGLKDER
jgi:hypothetical protein